MTLILSHAGGLRPLHVLGNNAVEIITWCRTISICQRRIRQALMAKVDYTLEIRAAWMNTWVKLSRSFSMQRRVITLIKKPYLAIQGSAYRRKNTYPLV